MTDRFKIRYYNKLAKQMIYPSSYEKIESIYETLKQQMLWDCAIDVPMAYNHIKKSFLVFMQCSGVKDKNGKLIYEGDIVKTSPSGFFDNNRDIFYVKFTDGYRLAYKDWQTLDTISSFSNELFEVIGNIYENTEILKAGE